jgi:hypothetical protein
MLEFGRMCMNLKDSAGMGGEVISSAREMGLI